MAHRSLGSVRRADHILGDVETAMRRSFEARRGKLCQACRAMNALMGVDLTRHAAHLQDMLPN